MKNEKCIFPFTDCDRIPVRFMLGARRICGIPSEFFPKIKKERTGNAFKTTITGRADGIEITAECLTYPDFPVCEWVGFIRNISQEDTERISNFEIRYDFKGTGPVLHGWVGDNRTEEAFSDYVRPIQNQEILYPIGGNPCNGASPYMRLLMREYSVNLAIGWSGQWYAELNPQEDGVELIVRQQRLNASLHPGEVIRSPRLTAMAYDGTETDGGNLWRRWIFKYIIPKQNGAPLSPKLVGLSHPDVCEEFEDATTAQQLRGLRRHVEAGITPDIWWIDAGWYLCREKWIYTGTLKVNTAHFPDEMEDIGTECEKNGTEFLLWFEPQRVTEGSELQKEHPEWLLKRTSLAWKSDLQSIPEELHILRDSWLVNLSLDECTDWLIDRIDSIIKKAKVKVYREDFNIAPLPFWMDHEEEGRIGMIENGYVRNLQRMWQTLIKRNPGLWIDSCASGGRRNDLDTLRTPAVPLHYSDMAYGNHPLKQMHTRYMYQWIPYFKGQNLIDWDDENGHYERCCTRPISRFGFYSGMGLCISAVDARGLFSETDCLLARDMIAIWRRAARYMYGDYYPLTKFPYNEYEWFADQMDDNGNGYLLFLRNTCAKAESLCVYPHLEPEKKYRFDNTETGETFVIGGKEVLENGISVSLPKRSGTILFYTVQ